MTTSAPSSANRTATARPIRFAAPVTSATRPCKAPSGFASFSIMFESVTVTHSRRTGIPACPLYFPLTSQRTDKNVRPTLQSQAAGGLMHLDLLAIAAHPDDVELTCGGTLLKMAQRGYKTGILDLTAGEMGTRGTPEIRTKEAARAAKLLAVKWRGTLGVPDSDVQPSRQHKLRLAAMIRQLRPKTVILPYWEARHPDHYHAST